MSTTKTKFITPEELYNKNKELKKADVAILQEWLNKQNHLPKIDELKIILFLHSCHYKIDHTKSCIDNFYTIRTLCPEYFSNRDPRTNPAEVLDLVLYIPLPKLTPEGHKVLLAKLIDTNPDNYTFTGQVKAFDMATMLMLHQEGPRDGLIVITDMKDVTFGHFTKLAMARIKKFFYYLQESMPVRIKGMHFIYIPVFMDKIVCLIKPFMKGELFQVLHLHSSKFDTLYKFVPPECLPKDFGGELDSVDELLKIQRRNILENAEYFVQEEQLVADESQRVGKSAMDKEVFGAEGNFRKLSID